MADSPTPGETVTYSGPATRTGTEDGVEFEHSLEIDGTFDVLHANGPHLTLRDHRYDELFAPSDHRADLHTYQVDWTARQA